MKENPGWVPAAEALADLDAAEGRDREALEGYRKLLIALPEDPRVGDRLAAVRTSLVVRTSDDAEAALAKKDLPAARRAALALVEIDPSSPAGYRFLARSAEDEGRLEDAYTAAAKAHALGPADDSWTEVTAGLAMKSARYAEAVALYGDLAKRHPETEASLEEARFQFQVQNLPEAARRAALSPRLTRAQMAVLAWWLVPEVRDAHDPAAPEVAVDAVDRAESQALVRAIALHFFSVSRETHRVGADQPVADGSGRDLPAGRRPFEPAARPFRNVSPTNALPPPRWKSAGYFRPRRLERSAAARPSGASWRRPGRDREVARDDGDGPLPEGAALRGALDRRACDAPEGRADAGLSPGRGDRPAGAAGESFFVIVRGRVAVTILSPDGREVVVGSLGEGDHFGEMALVDEEPRSATVVAQERSELAVLSREVFFELLRSNFLLTCALLRTFSRRLRRANATIEGLASLDVKSRLARYFRELAAARGRKAGGGWAVVVRPAQREIADTIGSSRETVSRTMSQMAAEQLIVPKGRVVYVRIEEGDPDSAPPAPGPGR